MAHKREASFDGTCSESLKSELASVGCEVKQEAGVYIVSTTDPQAMNNAFKILNAHSAKSAPMPAREDTDEQPSSVVVEETTNEKVELLDEAQVRALTKKDAVAYATAHEVEVDKSLTKDDYIDALCAELFPPHDVETLEMGEGLSLDDQSTNTDGDDADSPEDGQEGGSDEEE